MSVFQSHVERMPIEAARGGGVYKVAECQFIFTEKSLN